MLLARMLGTGRSVVNAMLKRLERAGTLTLGSRSLKLVDVAALRQMAGPDLALP
ncbi:MAG TPA: helix-turn-helix domain-containing protein [Burkholderiales bacterium]|nr:helix-turn-helix domain-containing protein [Burkholderiales bacterium]